MKGILQVVTDNELSATRTTTNPQRVRGWTDMLWCQGWTESEPVYILELQHFVYAYLHPNHPGTRIIVKVYVD